jgi:hypothetical protein
MGGISDLFSKPQAEEKEPSSEPSETSSTSSGAPPLSPESQRILDSIPDSVGNDVDGAGGPQLALAIPEFLSEETVRAVLSGSFGALAFFLGEQCRLTDEKLDLVTPCTTEMFNSEVGTGALFPQWLQDWLARNPKRLEFVLLWGIVLTPMAKDTWKVMLERSRARKEAARRVPGQVPAAPPPPHHQPGVPRAVAWEPIT